MRTLGHSLRDDADATTIGVLLTVALAIVLAGTLYVFVGGNGSSDPPPKAISLAAPRSEGTNTVNFTVAGVGSGGAWNDLTMRLDGVTGSYTMRVTGSDFSEAATDQDWVGGAELSTREQIMPGDTVAVTLAVPGQAPKLLIIDTLPNVLITSMDVLLR